MAANLRRLVEAFGSTRQMFAETTHRLRSVHPDVVEPAVTPEHSGHGESTGEWPASQVHDDWIRVSRSAGKDRAERLGQFFQVSQLVVIGVEKDTIPGRQFAPWFIEVRLTTAHDLPHGGCPVYSERSSRDGARVVVHTTGDLRASEAYQPLRQFGGHLTVLVKRGFPMIEICSNLDSGCRSETRIGARSFV